MSYNNPRLKLEMTLLDMIGAFSEGKPGAIRVLCDLSQQNPIIDPDDAFGPIGPFVSLDNLDCYGCRIWVLFKDVCNQNVNEMLGLLRAVQLGFVSKETITVAIDDNPSALDKADLLAKVKEYLPRFQIKAAEPSRKIG